MLLRYVLEQELENRKKGKPRRIAFFLVDTATLVYQQHTAIETNIYHPSDRFCGDLNVDSWEKSSWAEHFTKNMICVMTADVLYNCLSRGFIQMNEINLLVFDEAHHTKKNHPYARSASGEYLLARTNQI
jgi:endoribonuclease Dicer